MFISLPIGGELFGEDWSIQNEVRLLVARLQCQIGFELAYNASLYREDEGFVHLLPASLLLNGAKPMSLSCRNFNVEHRLHAGVHWFRDHLLVLVHGK